MSSSELSALLSHTLNLSSFSASVSPLSDVNKVKEGIGDKVGNALQWFFTFIAGMVIGFIKGWKLSLVILAVSPLLAISGGIMSMVSASGFGRILTS